MENVNQDSELVKDKLLTIHLAEIETRKNCDGVVDYSREKRNLQ